MTSGAGVYSDLNAEVHAARSELDRLARELENLRLELHRSQAETQGAISGLAQARLQELVANPAIERLDSADHAALKALEARHGAFLEIEEKLRGLDRKSDDAEKVREGARDARDSALSELESVVGKVRATLRADVGFQHRERELEALSQRADSAQKKADQAAEERVQKGRSFESDKLFQYLWKRRFGFSEYRGRGITRFGDEKVARLIGYDDAHRDYRFLIELPDRLRAHVEKLRAKVEEGRGALAAEEEAALKAAAAQDFRQRLAEAERALDRAEDTLEAIEKSRDGLVRERGAIAAGEDAFTKQALDALTRQIAREDVATLRADAAETVGGHDDTLVEQLARESARRSDLEQKQAELRRAHAAQVDATNRLEELRRQYRRQDWDSNQSVFGGSVNAGEVIRQVLHGAVVLHDALRVLQRNQSFRIPRVERRTRDEPRGGWTVNSGGTWGGRSSSPGPAPSRPADSGSFRTTDRF